MFEKHSDYLSGVSFHNGLKVECKHNEIEYRNEYLLNLIKNKKVLHIGFVDHLPLLENKIKKNNWLHKQLIDVAAKCVGIDINEEGINYLKEHHNIKDIYCVDILNDELPDEILKENFDYLLLPDVIEHIGDPVLFLKHLKQKFTNINQLVITTPNAFRYDNIKNSIKNIECINSDHRFWFTPYTIAKVLNDSGYTIEDLLFAEHSKSLSRRYFFKRWVIKRKSMLRDNLILLAK